MMEQADDDQRQRGATGIDEDIIHGRTPGWDEGLVVFIRGAVESRDQQRYSGPPPIGSTGVGLVRGDGTPEKDAENAVLPDVGSLADAEMDKIQSLGGDMRKEPQQQRPDDATGVGGGEGIG